MKLLRYMHRSEPAKRAVKAAVPRGSEIFGQGGQTSGQQPCMVRWWARHVLLQSLQRQAGRGEEDEEDWG